MPIIPEKLFSAVVVGRDLHTALVDVAPWRTRARRGPVLKDFLDAPIAELRRALPEEAFGRVLTLTVPSEVCSVRASSVGPGHWNNARAEVHRSIGKMFPISPEDAALGFVARDPLPSESADEAGGFLVVAQREAIAPALERARELVGPKAVRLLSPHMAVLGMGYQRLTDVGVLDQGPTGAPVIHRMRRGRVVALAESWDPGSADAATIAGLSLWRLPRATDDLDPAVRSVASIDPHELAIAAALAPRIAGGELAPLEERLASPPQRWVAPAAATAAALLLLWGAQSVINARFERGIDRIAEAEELIDTRFQGVQAMRRQLDRARSRIELGVRAPTGAWAPILPVVAEAESVVPTSGFVYSIDVSPERVLLRGEAPLASDVLQRLEGSEMFDEAALQDPAVPVSGGGESFHLRADRVGTASQGGQP